MFCSDIQYGEISFTNNSLSGLGLAVTLHITVTFLPSTVSIMSGTTRTKGGPRIPK